ncbi:MAG: hypothetical protein GY788_11595 [bacterium]|nr:hypothetical protein [bacterium]
MAFRWKTLLRSPADSTACPSASDVAGAPRQDDGIGLRLYERLAAPDLPAASRLRFLAAASFARDLTNHVWEYRPDARRSPTYLART